MYASGVGQGKSLAFDQNFFATIFNFNTLSKKALPPHPLHKLAGLMRKFGIFLVREIAKCW